MAVIEYALLLALVAVVAIAAWGLFGTRVSSSAANSEGKFVP